VYVGVLFLWVALVLPLHRTLGTQPTWIEVIAVLLPAAIEICRGDAAACSKNES
jgi:hypothetical protein